MQNANDITVRLLIVDDSGENAETIVSMLRNSGIAVRPARPQNAEELGQIIGGQPIDLVLAAPAQSIPLLQVTQQIAASGKDIPMILLAETINETEWVEASANGIRAVALRSRPEHLLAVVRNEWTDLHARRGLRRIEAQMRETERRCDALISSSRDPIAYVHEGMHIRANEAYLEMFGFESFDDVEGISLLDMVAPQHVDGFKQLLKSLSKGEAPPPQYQVDARNQDGAVFAATMEFTPATYEGESCLQVVFRRRMEFDPELAREVEDLRQRDQVTGLLNRQTFMLHVENAVAQAGRSEGRFGLLLIEPDHYARLLPDIGLDSADALIAALARVLADTVGDTAQLARFGEHSLAVLTEGAFAQTEALADRIREAFAAQVFSIGERSATVTVSIGGVQVGEKIASIGQVLARATECQQAASELGNTSRIFDPAAVDRVEEERIQRWVARINEALAGDGFQLHYQPVLNLGGEPLELYEAYLRLDNNGELLSPTAFLGIAEEHGLLADINRWVVAHAISVLGERERAGHATHMMVKITPESFNDPQMVATIRRELQAHGVPGERLWLHAPEAKVFTHLRNAQQFLADVAPLGCRIGLEQFGSGLDSFQLLAHFQPQFLKLDRDFTSDFARTRENSEKIAEITTRAQEANIRTIAEFVADNGSMSLLFSAGVDYVQGEFVGPAAPVMNFDFG
ncbi:EAL domain-containing protein [Stenotrophomonas sp. SORGH_AS_0282]|uniref:GGDEF/EAL domain-containing response regulator n=1 Tax=Stenotrophomonas sp. SORGH_AS_0282 TaxID=3041763 RepID=UPI002784E925|nr:EAL domain-containing protein [Stenotrophomonas sp. SORGH_AS_0282]MDQ1062958.1 diguanylate cyclase (GGDEF)-like protein/PAS domain S-box-containing protein [Stenotrophomonas sp. SORGH_AS_0282]MDQ1188687.1 diguanylate cyclase (GGDEF)-like protein/PAS domain S-box-containing protein [Stenotrophomonas sp. SORGH_AS_0282]